MQKQIGGGGHALPILPGYDLTLLIISIMANVSQATR